MNPSSASSFTKLLSLCERNQILRVERHQNVISNVRYGPLGLLLRKNLFREWFSFSMYNSEIHMLPAHIQNAVVMTSGAGSSTLENALVSKIMEHYREALPIAGNQLPFGLCISAVCASSKSSLKLKSRRKTNLAQSDPEKIFWKPSRWTALMIAFFCTPSKSTSWFYYWQRQRHVWWRKFSAVPSQFLMSDISSNGKEEHQMSLQISLPWGSENIETVSVMAGNKLLELCGQEAEKIAIPHCSVPFMVLCRTDLDFAVLSYLYDALDEKFDQQLQHQGKPRTVLRLHHRLAPYKVSVMIDSTEPKNVRKLCELCSRLVKELKRNSMSVLPNPYPNENSVEDQFVRFDEMGVPYVVVLNDGCLVTGLAGLRNRDTTLQEDVHITELIDKLLMYLQMKPNT